MEATPFEWQTLCRDIAAIVVGTLDFNPFPLPQNRKQGNKGDNKQQMQPEARYKNENPKDGHTQNALGGNNSTLPRPNNNYFHCWRKTREITKRKQLKQQDTNLIRIPNANARESV